MKSQLPFLLFVLFTSSGYAGLVAQYGFEEGSGSIAFDSAVADGTSSPVDDGTIINAQYVPGKVGSFALRLSGSSSYVSLEPNGQNNDLLNNASGASFTTWIKIDAYPSDIGSLAFISTTNNSFESRGGMFISGDGFVEVAGRASDSSSFQSRVTSSQVALDEWIHIAGVIDYANDRIDIYFNGELQLLLPGSISFPQTTTSTTDSSASTLGSTAGAFEFFAGTLDDLRIYNEALDSSAVMQTIAEPTAFSFLASVLVVWMLWTFVRRRSEQGAAANP